VKLIGIKGKSSAHGTFGYSIAGLDWKVNCCHGQRTATAVIVATSEFKETPE
jgi:hypothetical protein